MASSGLGLAKVASNCPDNAFLKFLAQQADHAAWVGCNVWDLIQPAFMFMVGVAVPWSIANRQARGESFNRMFGHALWRSLALVLLAVFLTSAWSQRTTWVFTNVLAQIGLGYPFLFLLAFTRTRTQWLAAFGILAGYWLAFATSPLPPPDLDWGKLYVLPDWPHLSGFAAHWEKNYNFAAHFDVWFLNLFGPEPLYVANKGGYHTLNFIPSLATMLFGVLAGQLLRSELPMTTKLQRLLVAGIAGVAAGAAIGYSGLCPIVKRIWSPSWAIYSAGWVTLLLAGFVAAIDWRGWKKWAFPFVVVGLNPITLYCMWQLTDAFVRAALKRHFGQNIYETLAGPAAPTVERFAVLLVFWLILFWMYRRKIFLRI